MFRAALNIFHGRYSLRHAIRNGVVGIFYSIYGLFHDFQKFSSQAIFYYWIKTELLKEFWNKFSWAHWNFDKKLNSIVQALKVVVYCSINKVFQEKNKLPSNVSWKFASGSDWLWISSQILVSSNWSIYYRAENQIFQKKNNKIAYAAWMFCKIFRRMLFEFSKCHQKIACMYRRNM